MGEISNVLWPEHPIFNTSSKQQAAENLNLFDDGLIFVGSDFTVISVNIEASSIIEKDSSAVEGDSFRALCRVIPGWSALESAVKCGTNTELAVRSSRGKSILVSIRKSRLAVNAEGQAKPPMLVILRDMEVYEYRHRKALGSLAKPAFRTLADNKARPDFNTQRRISPALEKVLSRGERAISQGARVLITGESGVGKTEVCRYFHSFVADSSAPFQMINCASIPESLFESEMFGYEKGSFTGALQSGKAGFIEQAEGGTLFLDEIGEVPLCVQAKLLSFLEDSAIRRIGGGRQRAANVRVIAATNRNLREMVSKGQFRADLFYRLAVIHLPLPSLRTMPELIDHLVDRFVRTVNQRRNQKFHVDPWIRRRFMAYSWPGNVRELLNVIQQLSIFCDEKADMEELLDELLQAIIVDGTNETSLPSSSQLPVNKRLELLLEEIIQEHDGEFNLKGEVRRIEKLMIDKAIKTHGSKRKAALALGVDIGTIVRKTTGPSIN